MRIIYRTIRLAGGRITKTRRAIINILLKQNCFLSNAEIVNKLKKQKLSPNRSTVYRELAYLTKRGLASKAIVNGTNYFEITRDHHHHLVCLSCHSIKKISLGNHLKNQTRLLAKQNNFNVASHSLEFYGHCRDCRKA